MSSTQLGQKYFSLDAARVDASPTEIIVSNDGNTYYIITPEEMTEEIKQQGYKEIEGGE
ncbi:hypothetical protein [Metabacillus malikii]|uniref:Uncharacterized protein n=1 Tax=Metabacillus malikii TaxID=1504265 RepID=A0ABT9Z9W0_9BACI|nr:hypothetical protein [Metabacillus malikii]MDQ0228810.1 hypothetical protein [Metabacillus malikii]